MVDARDAVPLSEVSFCSSLADDVWHRLAGPNAFESWHFDAVSDDGREVVVISVYDNYVLSPRFMANSHFAENVTQSGRHRFPAISLTYARDGKPLIGSVNEFVEADFSWTNGECRIAHSSFRIDAADYGSGFVMKVDIHAQRGRRIRAEIEWLIIESDLATNSPRGAAVWNAAVPRADVSGRIELIGRRGRVRQTVHFRGTGYHDQVTSSNVHYRDLTSRMWGRAHFVDSTLIYDRLGGAQNPSAPGKLYLIKDGKISEYEADCEAGNYRRDRWGLQIPHRISFRTKEGIEAIVRPSEAFRSGFSEVKTLSEVELRIDDDRDRTTIGITEFVNPSRMRSRFLRWVSDLRIGREKRSPLF